MEHNEKYLVLSPSDCLLARFSNFDEAVNWSEGIDDFVRKPTSYILSGPNKAMVLQPLN